MTSRCCWLMQPANATRRSRTRMPEGDHGRSVSEHAGRLAESSPLRNLRSDVTVGAADRVVGHYAVPGPGDRGDLHRFWRRTRSPASGLAARPSSHRTARTALPQTRRSRGPRGPDSGADKTGVRRPAAARSSRSTTPVSAFDPCAVPSTCRMSKNERAILSIPLTEKLRAASAPLPSSTEARQADAIGPSSTAQPQTRRSPFRMRSTMSAFTARGASPSSLNTNDLNRTRPMNLNAIDHVAISVKSLEDSFRWYSQVLGFQLFHKFTRTWMVERDGMKLGLM